MTKMNRMKQLNAKKFTVVFFPAVMLLLTLVQFLHAQSSTELKFVAVVSEKNLSLRQPFQVQFIVYGSKQVADIKVPAIKGFLLNDEFSSQSSQVIGGQTLQWIDSYSKVLVLTPKSTGKFTIPAATVKINGKTLQTKPVQITVRQTGLSSVPDASSDAEPVVQDESELAAGESMEEKVKKNFFLRANSNKTVCYVGEPLEVSYKAYSRLNSNSQVTKRPSFPGFSVVEMVGSYDNRPEVELVNGKAYYTNLIRKVQLFPLQPGNYQLDPAEVESVVHFIKAGSHSSSARPQGEDEGSRRLQQLLKESGIDRNPGPAQVNHYTTLKTPAVNIEVRALPTEGQPADFAGAVGTFTLETKMPDHEVRQGELIKLRWILSGSGNLQLVSLPDVQWPKGIDTSEPSVKEEINSFVYPLSGKKTFEYAVSARDSGDYTIPPVSLSYFDPETAGYKTITTEEIRLHVLPSNNKAFFAAEPVKNLSDKPLHLYWFGGVAVIIIGWITFQSLRGRREPAEAELAHAADEVEETQKEPVPTPLELFTHARTALEENNTKTFFREIQRVLWSVAAGRCDVLPSFLNKQNISFQLQKMEIPTQVINSFLSVLNECEWALYTPDHSPSDMKQLLDNAVAVSESLGRSGFGGRSES